MFERMCLIGIFLMALSSHVLAGQAAQYKIDGCRVLPVPGYGVVALAEVDAEEIDSASVSNSDSKASELLPSKFWLFNDESGNATARLPYVKDLSHLSVKLRITQGILECKEKGSGDFYNLYLTRKFLIQKDYKISAAVTGGLHSTRLVFRGDGDSIVLPVFEAIWFCPSSMCDRGLRSDKTPPAFLSDLIASRRGRVDYFLMTYAGEVQAIAAHIEYERAKIFARLDKQVISVIDGGFGIGIGFGFHRDLTRIDLQTFYSVWREIVARYSNFAPIWLISGEYNRFNDAKQVSAARSIVDFVKRIDFGANIVSLHPWIEIEVNRNETCQTVKELSLRLVQTGHSVILPSAISYDVGKLCDDVLEVKNIPSVEIECSYIGVLGRTANDAFRCAFLAVLRGSVGIGVGEQGIWYPFQSADDRQNTVWGKNVSYDSALYSDSYREIDRFRESLTGAALDVYQVRPTVCARLGNRDKCSDTYAATLGNHLLVYLPADVEEMKISWPACRGAGLPPRPLEQRYANSGKLTAECIDLDSVIIRREAMVGSGEMRSEAFAVWESL